jgi:iron(III) transport system ATP-binding protein
MSGGAGGDGKITARWGARVRAAKRHATTELSQLRHVEQSRKAGQPALIDDAIPAIALAHVTKRFEAASAPAVDDLTLDIKRGQFWTLLGPSGSGKTSTLRLIAGFLRPDSGTIHIDGALLSSPERSVPEAGQTVGMLFQNHALWPHKTVFENVAAGLKPRKMPPDEVRRKVAEALALMNLASTDARYPDELSGGQQQRIALARGLVTEPKILLLDEPLSHLDATLREQLRGELKALQRRTGMTFVYVTQDRGEALAVSDQVAVIDKGKLQQVGTPHEVYARPASPAVAALVGHMNVLAGTVSEIRMGVAQIDAGPDLRLEIPVPAGMRAGDALDIAIRPENIRLTRLLAPPKNGAPAKIREHTYLGNINEYRAELSSGRVIRVQAHPTQRFAPGDIVSIEVDGSQCILFPRAEAAKGTS